MLLFRPTGLDELALVYESGMQAWPLRRPEQPIFYPVLNEAYAAQIASTWNVQVDPYAGYVTQFEVSNEYAARFPRRVVGGRQHEELWVPAEELAEFNRHLIGRIRVVGAYFGPSFTGLVPERGNLKGLVARAQLDALAGTYAYSLFDFAGELSLNHLAVFLHYPYWDSLPGADQHRRLLEAVRMHWTRAFPKVPLPATSRAA